MLYKILMKIIIMYEVVYWVVRRTTLSIEEIVGEADNRLLLPQSKYDYPAS